MTGGRSLIGHATILTVGYLGRCALVATLVWQIEGRVFYLGALLAGAVMSASPALACSALETVVQGRRLGLWALGGATLLAAFAANLIAQSAWRAVEMRGDPSTGLGLVAELLAEPGRLLTPLTLGLGFAIVVSARAREARLGVQVVLAGGSVGLVTLASSIWAAASSRYPVERDTVCLVAITAAWSALQTAGLAPLWTLTDRLARRSNVGEP